jgi:RNA-directed DNA polymerase
MIRYADDFIVICKTREESIKALEIITEWTIENGLILHPEKTKILDAEVDPIEFLGYRFSKGKKYPKDKSIKKYRDSIRKHTRRTNSSSLAQIIKKITPIMRGWFEYYKHSYKTTFPAIDGWTRRRLRSVLKKYEKRSGIATTYRDNIRYPNKIFEDAGFFSLTKAHQELCRSLQ